LGRVLEVEEYGYWAGRSLWLEKVMRKGIILGEARKVVEDLISGRFRETLSEG